MQTYSFLWRGLDPVGVRRGVRCEAPSAAEAKSKLEQEGWSELDLLCDEIGSLSATSIEIPTWLEDCSPDPNVEARVWVEGTSSVWRQWMDDLRESWGWILVTATGLAWGIYQGSSGWIWCTGIVLTFLILLSPGFNAWFGLTLRTYERLNRAKVWARWDEVIQCVEQLERRHRWTRIGLGDVELRRNKAVALAATGRLEQGVSELKSVESSFAENQWLYLAHLAGVYDAAKQFDRATDCSVRALAQKPDQNALWIDLAMRLARHTNRFAEARDALEKAKGMVLSNIAKLYVQWIEGIILWRENRLPESRSTLQTAIDGFEANSKLPLIEGLILLSKAYLCVVEGALGNREEARMLFHETERFLIVHKEKELLQLTQAACGSA